MGGQQNALCTCTHANTDTRVHAHTLTGHGQPPPLQGQPHLPHTPPYTPLDGKGPGHTAVGAGYPRGSQSARLVGGVIPLTAQLVICCRPSGLRAAGLSTPDKHTLLMSRSSHRRVQRARTNRGEGSPLQQVPAARHTHGPQPVVLLFAIRDTDPYGLTPHLCKEAAPTLDRRC